MNRTTPNHLLAPARPASRNLASALLLGLLFAASGCRSSSNDRRAEDFFTSGSREADQRASQRMAKAEQLSGSGEGGGKERVSGAKAGDKGGAEAAQVAGKLSLFERLGGETGLAAIVEDFTPRAMQDPRVDWPRKSVKRRGIIRRGATESWDASPENVAVLQQHLVQFLALATGGPARYDGKDIESVHAGMRISNPEFDAVLGDLKASLDKLRIPNKEQKELLAIVESTRPQIVTER
jgi:hemoglobin